MTLRIAACFLGMSLVINAVELHAADKPKQWRGTFPVAELKQLPKDSRTHRVGAIRDEKTFAIVWKALQPKAEIPKVDFTKQCVVFAKNVRFFNPVNILKLTRSRNTITVAVAEGRSARPIKDKVVMSITIVAADAKTVIKD